MIIGNNLPLIQQTDKGNPLTDDDINTVYSPFFNPSLPYKDSKTQFSAVSAVVKGVQYL